MLLHSPYLQLVAALSGLLLGTLLFFLAPRLVAHRLDEAEDPSESSMLVPLAGGWLAGENPWPAIAFEAGLAAVFVALSLHYGARRELLLACGFTALLFLISYIDLQHRLVLNVLSYPGIVLGAIISPLWPGLGLKSALLGALVALLILGALQIVGRGALGMGDTKLAVLIGMIRGLPTTLQALFYGMMLGGLGALFYLLVLRRGRKESFPYGPYLAAGAILTFFLAAP